MVLDFGTKPALQIKLHATVHSSKIEIDFAKKGEERQNSWDPEKIRIERVDLRDPLKNILKPFDYKFNRNFKPNLNKENYTANMLVALKSEALERRSKSQKVFRLPILEVNSNTNDQNIMNVKLGFEGIEEVLTTILSFRESLKCVRIGLTKKNDKTTVYEALINSVNINCMTVRIDKQYWFSLKKTAKQINEQEYVDLQFQLDFTLFAMINQCLKDFKKFRLQFLFPDKTMINEENISQDDLSDKLSSDQLKIFNYCQRKFDMITPPLVIYGPFGTGKSYSLAQVALLLSKSDKNARILIASKNKRYL